MPHPQPSFILDFHAHAFPDALAAQAMPKLAHAAQVPAYYDGTVAGLRASMRRHRIAFTVLQPVATKPAQVAGINRWCAGLRGTPGILTFGALHPDLPAAEIEKEIAFISGKGIRGVKLHPDYQQFYPDEDRLADLYGQLEAAGLAILFHAGIDLGLAPPVHGTPARIAQVHKAYPRLPLIVAHMGGFRQWEEAERVLLGQDVFLDTAYSVEDCPPARFTELARAHGTEKVFFASDGPWGDQGAHLDYLCRSSLTEDEIRAVAGENARRWFGPETFASFPSD